MKTCYLIFVGLLIYISSTFAQSYQLKSPDGSTEVQISLTNGLQYSVTKQGNVIIKDVQIGLNFDGQLLGERPSLKSQNRKSVKETISPVVPMKFSLIDNNYNSLLLSFKENYAVEFRVFNDGVAYRFITSKKGKVKVMNEKMQLEWPMETLLHIQQPYNFRTSYEEPYSHTTAEKWLVNGGISTLPILAETTSNYKILVSESDLRDYPCMFIKGNGNSVISAIHPEYPFEFGLDANGRWDAVKHADYIADTDGTRSFPWRYFYITKEDAKLLENTMTIRLASPNKIKDCSWIKPGMSSWDYWNGAAPYGPTIDFETGLNQKTYECFIDFSAKWQIPYYILDEGWALDKSDPYTANPNADLQKLIKYAHSKKVGLIIWMPWDTADKHPEVFAKYREWGVSGVKIDFMKRSDQWMVNYYERIAKLAADNQLLVVFHGAFKPAGLEYEYPNVLAYEGVRGMEQMQHCIPNNTVYIPFIRNAVGPMDYTPGAMVSMQPEYYSGKRPEAASIGTRAYQMALFPLFETGMQMMADSPTRYENNSECTEFMAGVPVTWDETIGLQGKIGEYVAVAKRKGEKWYISAITNDKAREIELSFDFLPADGGSYTITLFKDGINANRNAMDYRKEIHQVTAQTKWTVRMAHNGGWTAVINKRM